MTEAAEKLWPQSQLQAQTEKSSVGIARLALAWTPPQAASSAAVTAAGSSHSLLPRYGLRSDTKNPVRGMTKPDRLHPHLPP